MNVPKKGRITERDQRLFRFLFNSKVANVRQINEHVFRNISFQATHRRLNRLLSAGWLERTGHSSVGGPLHYAYWISEEAYDKFILTEGENDRRRQLKSDSVEHDLALVDIRASFLRNSAVTRYLTENQLQSDYRCVHSEELKPLVELRSDAAIAIQESNRDYWIPIEYERSIKSIDSCKRKVQDYYLRFNGDMVFFICGDDRILQRMMEIQEEFCAKYGSKFYFSMLPDVLKSSDEMAFFDAKRVRHVLGKSHKKC